MAHMTQTIVECDRCGEQFSDSAKVRKIVFQERTLPADDRVHPAESWRGGVEMPDLCESCAHELLAHFQSFGASMGDS